MSVDDTLIIPPPPVLKAINAVVKTLSKNYLNDKSFDRTPLEQSLLSRGDLFQFVEPTNPFHAYYQKSLEEEMSTSNTPVQKIQQPISLFQPTKSPQNLIPPSFTNKSPPDIGAYKLDVIYLTAQYIARYGKEFGAAIAVEQKDSELFDFMRPGMPYFRFFSSLVEQYRLALHPSHLLRRRLEQEAQSIVNIKSNFDAEAEVEKQQIAERKAEEAQGVNTDQDDQYDWDDFVVLGTIDFEDPPIPDAPPRDTVKLPRHMPKPILQKSPYTGEMIKVEEFGDHLRFERRHPQYEKELATMKERREQQHSALAPGGQIADNLKQMVEGIEPPPENTVVWDGRQETIPLTVAAQARKAQEGPPARPDLKKKAPVIGPTLPKRTQ